jgi:MFS transporter, OFA family, oxalate/formate antiporter
MKNKIFYGWWILLAMTIMYAATNGFALFAFGVLRNMQASQSLNFGLNTQTQALLPTILLLVFAFVSPFIGWAVDRYNTKSIIMVGAILSIILTFSHQFITSYTGLCLIYVFFAVAMSCAGIISFMYLVHKWFRKNFGLATGILLVGSSLGSIIFPRIAASAGDWRIACNWLSIAAVICLIPPLFFIKNKPSDIGETPDGLPLEKEAQNRIHTEGDMPLKAILKKPLFYGVLAVTGILCFCINGYIQNHALFMTDLGKNTQETATILGTFFTLAIGGKLLFGWLADKFSKLSVMVAGIVLIMVSIILMKQSLANPSFISPYALVFGVGFGGAFSIIQIWLADLYAGKNFGAILGVATMVNTLAGIAGMLSLGLMRKTSGSFANGFNLLLILCLLALICTFLLKKLKLLVR